MNQVTTWCYSIAHHAFPKLILSGFFGIVLYLVGANNWNGLLALSVICMVDLIMALYVCIKKKIRITSSKLPAKAYEFSIYVLVVIAMNMLTIVSNRFSMFVDILMVYFSLTEGFSVLEHMSELGYKIPVAVLRDIRKETE